MEKTTQEEINLVNEGFKIGYDSSKLIEKLKGVFVDPNELKRAEDYAREIYSCRRLMDLKSVGAKIDSFLKGQEELKENPFAYHFLAYAKMLEAQTLFGGFSGADDVDERDLGVRVVCPFL